MLRGQIGLWPLADHAASPAKQRVTENLKQ